MRPINCLWIFATVAILPGMSHAATVYWNLFNIEGESTTKARYATYGTLDDMLNDTNRLVPSVPPDGAGFAQNIVGSGAFVFLDPLTPVPVPASLTFAPIGLAAFAFARRRKRKAVLKFQSEI